MTTDPTLPAAVGAPPACPACESNHWRRRFEKKGRVYWQCLDCGLECQHPLPTLDQLAAYYDQSYEEGLYRDFVDAAPMKRLTAEARLRQIEPRRQPGRWLDVGCADGVLLKELTDRGIEAAGVELSQVASQRARNRGLEVFTGPLEEFTTNQPLQNLSAFDVLEHVLDPVDFVRQMHRLLEPGGVVAITVPNLQSLSRALMRKRWYLYIPEEHLHLFTKQSILRLLHRCGFEEVEVWPTYKPLTFEYSLLQFEQYNPWIYGALKPLSWIMPKTLQQVSVPLYIGELMVVARRSAN